MKQNRRLNDFVGRDALDAQQIQKVFPVEKREQVIRRLSVIDGTTDRIDMGENEVHSILRKIIEGRTFWNNIAK